ncbi:DUF1367 family protein [Sphingopyxis macrogoltabida]|uniref:Uncharacterized protein n=1 Tax=Sphingopyxis macrogoltabida TaxID=33050 RepID=A0AAC8Z182_SPHMC|nr:DUF1367 family protein [Sphingopyxis macrogoltabida]ALJ12590.1 hypothetical protein LH19_06900 [Sphingopyxis macrogoltabida]AMU89939.1 hypothetical protein ATM17_12920 [Sphingopyxis macrogoltabida]
MKGNALFRRAGLALAPANRDARELLSGVKDGDAVLVEVWSPRNMAQHRKYFAILNNVVEATGRWTSTEHLRRDILISLHRYDEYVNEFTGEIVQIPHSMAVASMTREDFERLYSDTIRLLTEALGADPEMLSQEAA